MRLLEMMKSFGAETARVRASVSIDPNKVGQDILHEERGYRRYSSNTRRSPEYLRALTEAAKLIVGVRKGEIDSYYLREALSTDDFPLIYGDLKYKQLLGNYTVLPTTYTQWAQQVTVADFKDLNLYTLEGGRQLPELIKQYAPYPEMSFTESKKSISVAKYGRRFGLSLEDIINDDMNAWQGKPSEMAVGMRMMEEKTVYELIADANGPRTDFFNTGNGNKLTANTAFGEPAVEAIIKLASRLTDSDGNPVYITGWDLLYPPALEVPVQKVLNATQLLMGIVGTDATQTVTANWLRGRIRPIQVPWLPLISSSANGDTAFYMVAKAGAAGRAPVYYAKLRGRENPQLFMRSSDSVPLGGSGEVSGFDGSFDNDSMDFKARHFFGGAQGSPELIYASNGSGIADS